TLFGGLLYILLAPGLHINVMQHAIGAESLDEPHISLEADNQPLGEVPDKITLDTAFEFRWNDQWSAYPVYASPQSPHEQN
ncbi:MAG: hypothetical protein PVF09_13670, partial [Desulfobacterales bacterium]